MFSFSQFIPDYNEFGDYFNLGVFIFHSAFGAHGLLNMAKKEVLGTTSEIAISQLFRDNDYCQKLEPPLKTLFMI